MMRDRRFAGDIRMGSPPQATLRGGRGYSPLRRRSRSPTRTNLQDRDYSRDCRPGSPTRTGMQGRETQDYSLPRHELRDRHWNLELETSRRVMRSEHSRGSIERSEYSRHLEERQLGKLSQFNEGLSQFDSPSSKFQWKHLLHKHKTLNGYANHNSNHVPVGASISSTRVSTERNYQGRRFADRSRSGTRLEKSMPMETERDQTFPAYPRESGTKRSSNEIDGVGLLFPSQILSISHKDEGFRFQDHLPTEKLSARELYKQEDFYSREEKHHFYSQDVSKYVLPSSQSKSSTSVPFGSSMVDYHHSFGDDFLAHSDGLNLSSGINTKPTTHEAYTRIAHLRSSRDPNLHLEDTSNFRQVHLSANNGTHRGYAYPEVRSAKSEVAALSNRLYGKISNVQDDYTHQDSLGTGIAEPWTDRMVAIESSCREHLADGRLRDHHYHARELPISNYVDPDKQPLSNYLETGGSSYASKTDGEGLGLDVEHETKVYPGHGYIYLTEDHDYGTDDGLRSDEERLHMLLMTGHDSAWDAVDNDHQEGFSMEDLDLLEQSRNMLKRKLDLEKNGRSKFSSNKKISTKIHEPKPDNSFLHPSRYENIERTSNEMVGCRNPNSVATGRLSACNPNRLKSRISDIKRRLGPVPQDVHIPQPPVKKYRMHKILRENEDGLHETTHAEEEGPLEGNQRPVKSEAPEKSEEFKQLVQDAFFKFVKLLHENLALRSRLSEQGKAGCLKCSVCGSDREFLDTESLVRHACTAPRVGFRAQHLGLHKALCYLMGWQSAETLNTRWICQLLPDADIVALKEDLIIWPPIVVVHNSSITNTNPDERVIVSIEALGAKLRDMGFGEKIKVCRGKPANQSIMVVSFSGTLSGLQEAKKLHKFYADNKHGRTEFQQINPYSIVGVIERASANDVDDLLYGYLGIAGDLDKLDFETKKWCFVKSKKGIQEMADAPLKIEWKE